MPDICHYLVAESEISTPMMLKPALDTILSQSIHLLSSKLFPQLQSILRS